MGWVFGYPVALNQLQELPALATCLYAGSATDPPIAPALVKIYILCSSEHVTDVRQDLLDLAKEIQCDHLESGRCQRKAEEILEKLTSRQGTTTIHRQHSTSDGEYKLVARGLNHPLPVTHRPLPVTHNVDQWSTGSGEQAMNNTPAGRQVEGDTSNTTSTAPPGPSLPASDVPDDKQRDLATLSTLYRNTAHIVRRHQDGTDTKEFCNLLKEIETACKSLNSDIWRLNDSQRRTVNDLLIRTGIVDLLCEVMADGLESNDDATWDGDQDTNAAVIAVLGFNRLRYVDEWREVWCRVCDDARLLPVLLKKLKDWYRPHMDKTLKKQRDGVIGEILHIISHIARQDDKRERLRQLGVTGVLVNFLTSPVQDCRWKALLPLCNIVTEEELDRLESTQFVTSFCDIPDDGVGSWRNLTKNAVTKRVLIQKGALLMLMERVWQADSVNSKHSETPYNEGRGVEERMGWVFGYPVALNQLQELPALATCLYADSATDLPIARDAGLQCRCDLLTLMFPALDKIDSLCLSEHVTADVRQVLLDLAKEIQYSHVEFRWCQDKAREILKKLTSRQGATTIHRQHGTSAGEYKCSA
ncbi:hypothetical protein BaRGS_00030098 [Batillaria attramentaria]|uniref:Ig-like domain-containing protein n=1 Tax=Batillaria attramentaria TaxID=370345 RepID=A0ABD0JVH6_9CAEN